MPRQIINNCLAYFSFSLSKKRGDKNIPQFSLIFGVSFRVFLQPDGQTIRHTNKENTTIQYMTNAKRLDVNRSRHLQANLRLSLFNILWGICFKKKHLVYVNIKIRQRIWQMLFYKADNKYKLKSPYIDPIFILFFSHKTEYAYHWNVR